MKSAQDAEMAGRMDEELRVFAERLRSAEFAAAAQAFFGKSSARKPGGT